MTERNEGELPTEIGWEDPIGAVECRSNWVGGTPCSTAGSTLC
jgi:hypothetical protein